MSRLPAGSRVFLTGGTGFVGRSLLRAALGASRELFAQDVRITILSRSPQRFLARYAEFSSLPWLEFVQGDVRSFDFPRGRFTHVIHAAADTDATGKAPTREWIDAALAGTQRVLDFAIGCGANKLLFTSSGAVYAPQPGDLVRLDESHHSAPDSDDPGGAYGRAKWLAEQLCANAFQATGLDVKIARLFAFVGEDLPLDGHYAVGNFIRDALGAAAIEIQGDGTPVRSYLYAGDLARWLIEILERGQANRPYNVGSDEAVSIADLAQLVAQVVSPGKQVRIARARADYAGRLHYVPSIGRARAELGLCVETPLDEAIRRTAAWHRRNTG